MQKRHAIHFLAACTLLTGAMGSFGLAPAQTKLKWPRLQTSTVRQLSGGAGEESKLTNASRIQVFPASILG